MTDNSNDQITALEQEVGAMRGPMMDLHVDFVRAAAAWAGQVWIDYAATTVARGPEVARQRADDGSLSEAKQRVQALATDALTHAKEDLGAIVWPHLASDMTVLEADDTNGATKWLGPQSRFRVGKRDGRLLPPGVSRATGKLLARVQTLLRDYDFQTAYMNYEWDEAMFASMKDYATHHEALIEKRVDLADARRKRDERQASGLWDAA